MEIRSENLNDMRDALLRASLESNVTVAEALAGLVRESLMSDDLDPIHVNGIEFIQICDNCLMCGGKDESH